MRALLVGLVGAVLAVGGAHAKSCPLDGMELVAATRAADASADMVGARFRVVKKASRFKTAFNPAKGRVATSGEITVELVGDKGRFIVGQDYSPNSMPWVSASSWTMKDPDAKPHWGRRNRREEKKLFDPIGQFDIYGGPLAGLTLHPTNCR